MKICAYVQEAYAKSNYKNECMDTRQFVGLRVIIDMLERSGYEVDYAGIATVHQYDVVLVSITSDCDWWPYIQERLRWRNGNYKVIVGGAGVLHVSPFTRWADYFMLGRGENTIVPLIKHIGNGSALDCNSIIESATFDESGAYAIEQVDEPYPHKIALSDKRDFHEGAIGCNHKCLFCGYTWQRKFVSDHDHYRMEDNLFGGIADKERAMLDMGDFGEVDWAHLRTTAIDGFSERLRKMVNKPITKDTLTRFVKCMLTAECKPHQIKLYNVCGYPTETDEDWAEYMDTLIEADMSVPKRDKQWSIVLHSTPFRPMPATPMACEPVSTINYRGRMGRILGKGLKGNLIYQGPSLWSVESMGTDSLSSVMLSMIAHRGGIDDSESIERLCCTPKFWRASSAVKEATLSKYFDMDYLFGDFSADTLPSRYLRTYAKVENMWEGNNGNKETD